MALTDVEKQELKNLAEKVSLDTVETVFRVAELRIKDSANKVDDLLLPLLPLVKAQILKYVDKIDGEVG